MTFANLGMFLLLVAVAAICLPIGRELMDDLFWLYFIWVMFILYIGFRLYGPRW